MNIPNAALGSESPRLGESPRQPLEVEPVELRAVQLLCEGVRVHLGQQQRLVPGPLPNLTGGYPDLAQLSTTAQFFTNTARSQDLT